MASSPDEMTLIELVPVAKATVKAKATTKAKAKLRTNHESWHVSLDKVLDGKQSDLYRDALKEAERRAQEAERRAQESERKSKEAERQAKETDVKVRQQEQHLFMCAQHAQVTQGMLEREVHVAHIASKSALFQSEILQLEINARKEAERRASQLDAKRRRLELDLAEAEASLAQKAYDKEAASSSCQAQSVKDEAQYPHEEEVVINSCLIQSADDEAHDQVTKRTHKQKQNERRAALRKHKQDRI